MKYILKQARALLAITTLTLALAACGGGGGSSTATTQISGTVFAGPVSGGSVRVKNSSGTLVAGPVTTGTDGSYIIAIPTARLAEDLIFEASGGTYIDEATASGGVPLGALSAIAPGGTLAAGVTLTIDPSSTIMQRLVAGGRTRAAAAADFQAAFGYPPDQSIKPAFANVSTAASTSQRLAGLRIAAFSQLTKDLGIPAAGQHELINALADDLGDGILNGKMGGAAVQTASGVPIPEDIGNRFGRALLAFQTNPGLNKCKLTPDMIGVPVFYTTALTDSYRVEYLPGSLPAQGKSTFTLRLTDRATGQPVAGKAVALKPFMYMATKSHTTPTGQVVDNGDGTYSCTAYYVMPTAMNGVSMGVWEIKVMIGAEAAWFYPAVAMPMGNTPLAKLTGVADAINGMAGTEKRTWFLFNDGFTSGMGGTSTLELFLATKENLQSFPAVYPGSVLKNETGQEWTVATVILEASTNGTDWIPGVASGTGHYAIPGLTGLTAGIQGSIYVRLIVNGEQKTTDGAPAAGSNGYQTFKVTPGGM